MADKLRLGSEVRELKIGSSFTNNKSTSFHTLKCDFKPASVDASKMATVDVGTNNQVTVTVPHLDGAGIPQTVFKGNQKPCQKECVLIIDRITGEMTLEKLSSNLQVKKTRQEPQHKPPPLLAPPPVAPRPHTPVDSASNCTQRSTSRTRVASGGRRGPAAPTHHKTSPPRHRTSPPQATPWSFNAGQSTLASLPMIGLDEPAQSIIDIPHFPPPLPPPINGHIQESRSTPNAVHDTEDVGVLSSSSGSSSSGSDSEHSDSGGSSKETPCKPNMSDSKSTLNGGHNGNNTTSADASMPMQLLNDDLCLSESGSDSD